MTAFCVSTLSTLIGVAAHPIQIASAAITAKGAVEHGVPVPRQEYRHRSLKHNPKRRDLSAGAS